MTIQITAFLCCIVFSTCLCATSVEALIQPCAQCHGAGGVSTQARTPHLNGQLADYLEEDISGIAYGGRESSVQNHVPRNWSGIEIAAVARFYAASRDARPAQWTDVTRVGKGEALYRRRCAECHPDNGRGSAHDAPLLAAQSLDYLLEQVRVFVSGKRRLVFMMDDAFRGLSLFDLESIAHFFASQEQYPKSSRP